MPDRRVDPSDPMPRYFQVYASLLERIRSGEFSQGSLLPPERQLGEEYGVSRITVIKSLDMLEREGYVVRQQGRGTFVARLSGRVVAATQPSALPTTGLITVSLAFADAANHPYLLDVLAGVAGACAAQHHSLLVFGSVTSSQQERASVEEVLARGVRGVLVYPWPEYDNHDFYAGLLERGTPLVMIDRYYPGLPADHVVFDDYQAGFDLTAHLIRRGHTRIAFIPSEELRPTSVHDRLSGYRQALEAHGLKYDEDLIWLDMPSTFSFNGRQPSHPRSTAELLARHLAGEQATGLVLVNYEVAQAILAALTTLDAARRRQGRDPLCVNVAAISHLRPPAQTPYLSAIALQPGDLVGAKAVQLLAARMQAAAGAPAQHVVLPMPIIELPSGHPVYPSLAVDSVPFPMKG